MNTPKYNKGFEKYGGEMFFGKGFFGDTLKKARKNQLAFFNKICNINKKWKNIYITTKEVFLETKKKFLVENITKLDFLLY